MRKTIFNTIKGTSLLMLIIVFISCGNVNTSNSIESKMEAILIDTSTFAIISFDTATHFPFSNRYKKTNLTDPEIKSIGLILEKSIASYNSSLKEESKQYFEIDLNKGNYKKQFTPVVNGKGEKEVWVNCLCNTDGMDWKNEIILVQDGGSCYFNLKINLVTGKYYEFRVNGLA